MKTCFQDASADILMDKIGPCTNSLKHKCGKCVLQNLILVFTRSAWLYCGFVLIHRPAAQNN